MKKINKFIVLLVTFMVLFTPMVTANTVVFTVNVVQGGAVTETLGTYTTYEQAVTKMKSFSSTEYKDAVIYRSGEIVSSNYALVRFKNIGVMSLYKNPYDTSRYTSIHTGYGNEAAFIDYHEGSRRVKLIISGFIGYADISTLNVTPLVLLNSNMVKNETSTNIRIRKSPSTKSEILGSFESGTTLVYTDIVYNVGGYNWYKVNYKNGIAYIASKPGWTSEIKGTNTKTFYETYAPSGNLIHYFGYYKAGNFERTFVNNGPAPSYAPASLTLYSYDGHYFYKTLTAMLKDYKNNTRANSVNNNDPFYFYYQYLPNRSYSNYQVEDYNNILIKMGFTRAKNPNVVYVDEHGNWTNQNRTGMSVLYNSGQDFIDVQNDYAINAFQAFSTALNESANGTSKIAFAKNNVFGIGAVDSNPFFGARTYATLKDSIIGYAKLTGGSYSNPTHAYYHGAFYGNLNSGMNVMYATDPYWGEKNAGKYLSQDREAGYQDLYASTIGIKTTEADVHIRKEPNETSKVIYTLNNKNKKVSNMAVLVVDKVNGYYKVLTEIAIDENGNVNPSVDYHPNYSHGYVKESDLYVKNTQPVITANNKVFNMNDKYDLLNGVTAYDKEDKDISNKVDVLETNLDITKPGNYYVTYKVEDSARFGTTKKVNVTVLGSVKPVIKQLTDKVSQYKVVDLKTLFEAKDYTNKVINFAVTGTVNFNVVGNYELIVSATDIYNETTTETFNVEVLENQSPVINASDTSIFINTEYNQVVTAYDFEDGNVPVTIVKNDIINTVLGTYDVTYKAVDSNGNETIKTIKVTVSNQKLKTGSFYLDSIKKVNNELVIKGYQTINGINNNLDTNIRYEIILKNKDDDSIYKIDGIRITDKKEMTKPIYATDNYDYTYSWFKANIDDKNIKNGDYNIYVKAISNEWFSETLVSNRYYNTQITSFSGNKEFIIKNEYGTNRGAVLLNIKDEKIGSKTVDFTFNQFGSISKFEENNNKLLIEGTNYSHGMNLSKPVTRNIIFENKKTNQIYKFSLGSKIGKYLVATPLDDGYGKQYAWYEKEIDLSNIVVGEYIIYIETISNVSDTDYLTERMGRDLSNVVINANNKKYTFKINNERYKRVEMVVK